MVHPIEPDPRWTSPAPGATPPRDESVRYLTRIRADELAMQLLSLDKRWHERVEFLKSKETTQYHIDNDILLKNLSGATKVVSDMLTAMSTYLLASRPRR